MNLPILHGDVELHPIEKVPKGLMKIKFNGGTYVLRTGESHHKHTITAEQVDMIDIYQDKITGMHVIEVKKAVPISHEEHKTIVIEPGIYIEKQENEYNPFESMLRKVQD